MGENDSLLQNNSTIRDEITFGKILFATHFPISLAITGGNSIALVVFLRKTFRVKKSNYLLVNLTIADLLVGVTILAHSIITRSFNASFRSFVEKNPLLVKAVTVLAFQASVYTLSVISVERVLAVFWPFHHRLAKRWHYFTAIALAWIPSGITGFSPFFYRPNFQNTGKKLIYFFCVQLLVIISLLTIFISYFSIWIKMKFFTKFRNCRTIQENSKLTKTLFIVTVVSLGTWLPKSIMEIVFTINNLDRKYYINLDILLTALLLANSFINLVVYSFRMPEFRREIRQIFCNTIR